MTSATIGTIRRSPPFARACEGRVDFVIEPSIPRLASPLSRLGAAKGLAPAPD
jgi:hypothetical protein